MWYSRLIGIFVVLSVFVFLPYSYYLGMKEDESIRKHGKQLEGTIVNTTGLFSNRMIIQYTHGTNQFIKKADAPEGYRKTRGMKIKLLVDTLHPESCIVIW